MEYSNFQFGPVSAGYFLQYLASIIFKNISDRDENLCPLCCIRFDLPVILEGKREHLSGDPVFIRSVGRDPELVGVDVAPGVRGQLLPEVGFQQNRSKRCSTPCWQQLVTN